MAGRAGVPIKLWISYIIDWVMLIIFGLIAYAFTKQKPNPHNFSLVDLSISYPLKDDTVPIWVAGFVAGVIPAIVIAAVCFIFVPGRTFARGRGTGNNFKLKLWEIHAGWLGLAMSLAVTLMITQGLKLFGKPRPNCLSRCKPDIAKVADHYTGHYAGDFTATWALVDISICTETDQHTLYDGFQSWPSGHSSTSWSGLLYITLWLCAKFAVVLPYLPAARTSFFGRNGHNRDASLAAANGQSAYKKSDFRANEAPIRNRDEAAAPPVYMLLFIILPIGVAMYICVSRYMDYAHHGFDIISGSVIGIICAYTSFRWYHLPVGRGSGWSWGPRSSSRAFAVGVGECGYVDEETSAARERDMDEEVELGLMNGRLSSNVQRDGTAGSGFHQETAYGHAQTQGYAPPQDTRFNGAPNGAPAFAPPPTTAYAPQR